MLARCLRILAAVASAGALLTCDTPSRAATTVASIAAAGETRGEARSGYAWREADAAGGEASTTGNAAAGRTEARVTRSWCGGSESSIRTRISGYIPLRE